MDSHLEDIGTQGRPHWDVVSSIPSIAYLYRYIYCIIELTTSNSYESLCLAVSTMM